VSTREPSRSAASTSARLACLVVGAAIGITLVGAGCVTVQPHERKELAKPEMDPSADQLEETFHTHVEAAREGGFGGHGSQGGGCGCG
jgi:hypothetical protein